MSKENRFLIFAIEHYRQQKHLTGAQVANLFSQHKIYDLILENYFLYHIESPNNFIAEIDQKIKSAA